MSTDHLSTSSLPNASSMWSRHRGYLRRPPFIDELCFLDGDGQVLDFQLTTSPEVLQCQTSVGTFQLAFQDSSTLVFGLPDHTTCGVRFRVNSTHWHRTDNGGSVRHVRNIGYEILNGSIATNRPAENFSGVEIIVQTSSDCSISLHPLDGRPLFSSNWQFRQAPNINKVTVTFAIRSRSETE